jgi:DNA-binding CsgD family transcriptional regulator
MHVAGAMKKLGARTRAEAASLAVLQGRIAP